MASRAAKEMMKAPLVQYFQRLVQQAGALPTLAAVAAVLIVYWWLRRGRAGTANAAENPGRDAPATRSRAQGMRKVTYTTRDVLLTIDADGHPTLKTQSEVEVLLQLARSAELYLITRVDTDEEEAGVIRALREAGLVGDSAAESNKAAALFCSSIVGQTSMVRQLEPSVHIDGSVESLRSLQSTPLVKQTRLIYVGCAVGKELFPCVERREHGLGRPYV